MEGLLEFSEGLRGFGSLMRGGSVVGVWLGRRDVWKRCPAVVGVR